MITSPDTGPILKTREGRLLLFTTILIVLSLGAAAIVYRFEPGLAKAFFACVGFNLIGGRAPGIGVYIYQGYSPLVATLMSGLVEALMILVAYPVFVLTLKNYVQVAWIQRLVHETEKVAHRHQDKIQSYGWFGLMIYVFLPLPLTGPISGSFIGYFMKFGWVRNFSAVVIGTLFITAVWAFAFDILNRYLHIFQYVFGGLLLLMVILFFPKILHFLKFLIKIIKNPHHH